MTIQPSEHSSKQSHTDKWHITKSDGRWAAIAPDGTPRHFTAHAIALAYAVAVIDRNHRLIEVGHDLAQAFADDRIPVEVLS